MRCSFLLHFKFARIIGMRFDMRNVRYIRFKESRYFSYSFSWSSTSSFSSFKFCLIRSSVSFFLDKASSVFVSSDSMVVRLWIFFGFYMAVTWIRSNIFFTSELLSWHLASNSWISFFIRSMFTFARLIASSFDFSIWFLLSAAYQPVQTGFFANSYSLIERLEVTHIADSCFFYLVRRAFLANRFSTELTKRERG